MKGSYEYIVDGFAYICPECGTRNNYQVSDSGCDKCEFVDEYVAPDEWLEAKLSRDREKNEIKLRDKISAILNSATSNETKLNDIMSEVW